MPLLQISFSLIFCPCFIQALEHPVQQLATTYESVYTQTFFFPCKMNHQIHWSKFWPQDEFLFRAALQECPRKFHDSPIGLCQRFQEYFYLSLTLHAPLCQLEETEQWTCCRGFFSSDLHWKLAAFWVTCKWARVSTPRWQIYCLNTLKSPNSRCASALFLKAATCSDLFFALERMPHITGLLEIPRR